MSEPRRKDLIEDHVRFQHGFITGLALRKDGKLDDDDRKILERVAASLMRLWEIENAPDRYCVTMPDGSCVSTDPRCMHHAGVGPGMESEMRNHTQKEVLDWVRDTFGEGFLNERERVLRFIEEAIELGQACGLHVSHIHKLIDHVYERPLGERSKEIGGVMITLEALGAFLGISIDDQANEEWRRINKLPQSHFDAASDRKQRAGVCHVVGEGAAPNEQG